MSGCDLALRRGYCCGGYCLWEVALIGGFSGTAGFIRGAVCDFLCFGTGGGCCVRGVAGRGFVRRCGSVDVWEYGSVDVCECGSVDACGGVSCVSWSG